MTVEVTEESMSARQLYACVPIAFTVDSVLDVTSRNDRPIGFALSERKLEAPYEKNTTNSRGKHRWIGRIARSADKPHDFGKSLTV